jgi:nicotinamidase-related amidase
MALRTSAVRLNKWMHLLTASLNPFEPTTAQRFQTNLAFGCECLPSSSGSQQRSISMALPRLRPESTALLVIDVQERLMPTIEARDRVETNCALLARAAGVLGMPVVCTEQYVRGLGGTVAAVREALPATAEVIEKTQFSALVGGVRAILRTQRRPTILVCGVEAHVCVLNTALDLVAAGWTVFYATDAISAGQVDQVDPAFRRMERAGALPTGTLSAMYELLGDAAHPSFRDILALAKLVPKNA